MPSYLLRYQASSFDDNVFDSQQLSAVRGASLSYLYSGGVVETTLKKQPVSNLRDIYTGASQGAFIFDANSGEAARAARIAVENALKRRDETHGCNEQLAYVIALVSGDDVKALAAAESLCNAQKLQQGSFRLPAYDEMATKPGGRLDPRPAMPNDSRSAATRAREKFGRDQRQGFYRRMSNLSDQAVPFDFTDNLQDMVADPPKCLPLSLSGKIAMFYADGDKFGQRFKDAATKGLGHLKGVSNALKDKQRELLRSILAWFREHYGPGATNPCFLDGAARFETLLWGGDENLFVMPSWLGLEFAKLFYEKTSGWKLDGDEPWTYSAGLVICDHKTPIRQVKSVAKELAERSKDSGNGLIQIEIFESISMPDVDFDFYRRKLYFPDEPPTDKNFKELNHQLCIPGNKIDELVRRVVDLKKEKGLPRSQLYKMLLKASKIGAAASRRDDKDRELRNDFALWQKRAGEDVDVSERQVEVLYDLPPGCSSGSAKQPAFSLSLALAAMLWDYVEPLTGEGRAE